MTHSEANTNSVSSSSSLSNSEAEMLWHKYRTSQCQQSRQRLIEGYIDLAKKIAAFCYSKRWCNDVEYDDYYQNALTGLIEAIDRFDPSSEATFSTYATYRIRGAVINGLRTSTEKNNQYVYYKRLQRERAESLGSDDKQLATQDIFKDLARLSLDLTYSYLLAEIGLAQSDANKGAIDPYHSEAFEEIKTDVLSCLDKLSDNERIVIENHYFDHMEFQDVAKILDVSKGRVSQIHKSAIEKIRRELNSRDDGLELSI